ncbi:hypothetical protein D3C78_1401590 [compost metagenome]
MRGRSGSRLRSTITASAISENAARVPMLTSSASVCSGTKPAISAITVPTIHVALYGVPYFGLMSENTLEPVQSLCSLLTAHCSLLNVRNSGGEKKLPKRHQPRTI